MGMPKQEKPGTPDWIVTFTDLMSLLLCFFVLLLTFSTPRVEKLEELRGSIAGSFGIFGPDRDDRDTWIPPNPTLQGRDQKNPYAPTLMPRFRPLEDHEPNIDLKRLKDWDQGTEIAWDRVAEGWRVTISEAIGFDPASDEMTAESFPRLDKLAKALEFIPHHVIVVGLVGGRELPAVERQGVDPLDLATRRAVTVASALSGYANIRSDRLGVGAEPPHRGDAGHGRIELVVVPARPRLEAP